MKELTIDKRNGHVCYNDKYHVYWNDQDLLTYTSVTTLIGKYENFDRDFWLNYCALKELIGKQGYKDMNILRNLRMTKVFDMDSVLALYPEFTEGMLEEKRKELDTKWKANADKACEFGTKAHAGYEHGFKEKGWYNLSWYGFSNRVKFAYVPNLYTYVPELGRQVMPEMLVAIKTKDMKLRLAGQIDLCIIDKKNLYINDYKTNKSIDFKSMADPEGNHQMMKYPLEYFMDCNSVHYNLQMSIYTYMVARKYPELKPCESTIIHLYDKEDTSKARFYKFQYLESTVKLLLNHYRENNDMDYTKIIEKDGKYYLPR